MPYNALIPQAPDILSDSQDDLLNNFTQLNTAWNINHAPFNGNNPPQGQHTQVTLQALPNVALPGGPTPTVANTINIWSATSPYTTLTELNLQRASTVPIPVGPIIEWTGALAMANGWTRLPSGILLKWGIQNIVGFNQQILFPVSVNIPVFNTVFFVTISTNSAFQVTTTTTPATLNVAGFQANAFSVLGNPAPAGIPYLAIGT